MGPPGAGQSKALYVYVVRHGESENNFRDCHDVAGNEAAKSPGAAPPSKVIKVASGADAPGSASGSGNTAADANARNLRQCDPGLTKRGQGQADAVARLLRCLADDPATGARLRPGRVFVSGFLRALQTCRPISDALGVQPELLPDLHEEGGVFLGGRHDPDRHQLPLRHGLTGEQMLQHLPNLQGTDTVPAQGWWRGGCETSEECAARAQRCAQFLWSLTDTSTGDIRDGAVVCVTHGLFMDRLLKAFMGLPPTTASVRLMTANCAYWLLVLREEPTSTVPRHVVVAAANVIDHVPMSIRTGHKMSGFSHCQPSYLADGQDDDGII